MASSARPPTPAKPAQDVNPRDTVAARTILVAVTVAAVAALVAGAVALPLIRGAAEGQARSQLAKLADITAAGLEDPRPGTISRLRTLLAGQSTTAFIVGEGLPLPPGVSPEIVDQLANGESVSARESSGSEVVFIEGRPLDEQQGVVLVAPTTIATGSYLTSLRRIALAIVIGLVVAVVVAVLAARRLTRPMRQVAEAAEALTAGDRDVRLEPEGPVEVAEIAQSLNRLSQALAVSEGRQREFLLSVSHELRTPLTAVRGYAEALADGVVGGADVKRTGEVMAKESDRLERLVADLLDLSRLGAADLRVDAKTVDLRVVMTEAAAVWRDRCEREGVSFDLEVPDASITVRTDEVRVRQIIDNLAENALRVTPSGQPIVLSLSAAVGEAVIEVRDGGPGLTDDDVLAAFEPAVLYTRYAGIRPVGSGVGLALVGRLAGRLGGRAEAGHAIEGGARFTVRLPLQDLDPQVPGRP